MSDSNYKNNAESFSIQQIVGRGALLEIPSYQRLYEWEKEQIETLLEDVKKACFNAQGELQNKIYFIGNVVVSEQGKENESKYILIDGQQRLTTLFLIGIYLASKEKEVSESWSSFVKHDKQIRISMPLRENEEKWLLDFINKQNKSDNDFKDLSKNNPNIHYKITKGLETIAEWFEKNTPKEESDGKPKLASFAQCLYGNSEAGVRFALVKLAEGTDLNQFFVRMNNRGKQLEKYEILKAKLLKVLQEDDKTKEDWQKYAKIWDICSDMDKYIFALEEDRKIFYKEKDSEGREYTDKKGEPIKKTLQEIHNKKLYDIAKEFKDIDNLCVAENSKTLTLAEIIKNSKSEQIKEESKDASYHSIIDFPTFLLHVFKLFVRGKRPQIKVSIEKDKLLKIIWDSRENFWKQNNNVRRFIKQLLLYRFALDYFVIKQKARDSSYVIDWSYIVGGNSGRELFKIKNGNEELKNLVMIQNYLRVARAGEKQNYHHWLTYMLKEVYRFLFENQNEIQENDIKNFVSNIVKKLEILDTKMAHQQVSSKTEDSLLVIANQELLGIKQSNNTTSKVQFGFLNQGTGTPHYWFYRLEYYLWKGVGEKAQDRDNFKINEKNFKQIRENYRFRGLNSIEHFYPQSKIEENGWSEDNINNFGNLALISQSFNSSLGNQDAQDKSLDMQKKINKEDVESLKLWLMHAKKGENNIWTPDDAQAHQTEMLKVIAKSLGLDIKESEG